MSTHPPEKDYCSLFIGTDTKVPLLNGKHTKYINFDNAASTPPMLAVQQAVNAFMPYYSSVHRGTGYKSQLSTHMYEEARRIILEFVGQTPNSTLLYSERTPPKRSTN
jgi:cysteine desulfurase/selenocysteine lyase